MQHLQCLPFLLGDIAIIRWATRCVCSWLSRYAYLVVLSVTHFFCGCQMLHPPSPLPTCISKYMNLSPLFLTHRIGPLLLHNIPGPTMATTQSKSSTPNFPLFQGSQSHAVPISPLVPKEIHSYGKFTLYERGGPNGGPIGPAGE